MKLLLGRKLTGYDNAPLENLKSGGSPFGEGTPGVWFDANQVRGTYRHYRTPFEEEAWGSLWRGTLYSFWLDLHARRAGFQAAVPRLLISSALPQS